MTPEQATQQLFDAVSLNDDEAIMAAIINGADVNGRNIEQVTPLHCAARNERADIAQLLIENGAQARLRTFGKSR